MLQVCDYKLRLSSGIQYIMKLGLSGNLSNAGCLFAIAGLKYVSSEQ